MKRFGVSRMLLALALGARALVSTAHAQAVTCAQARACCEAANGGARCDRLAQLERVAPQACAAIHQQIVSGLQSSGRTVPAACNGNGAAASSTQAPSGAGAGPSATPPRTPATGETPAPTEPPSQPAPSGLPPEISAVTPGSRAAGASDDAPACTVVRVRGQRVQFSDETSLLELRCVGLPGVPARINGDPASFTPGRAPNGKSITVHWTVVRGGGTLSPNGNTATFANPSPRDGAEDTELRVRVAVLDRSGRELGQNTRTVIVRTIGREWTLEVTQRFDSTCTPLTGGSIVVGYTLTCDRLRVPLRIDNDGTIHSTSGGRCDNVLTRPQPCSTMVSNIQAPPPDVVSAVDGRIDRASGVVDLRLAGVHYGMPSYAVARRQEPAHGVEFLVPPLMLESVNGSNRTFAGPPGPLRGSRSYTIRSNAAAPTAPR